MKIIKRLAPFALALTLLLAPTLMHTAAAKPLKAVTYAAPSKPARECQATCETRAEQTVLACGRNGGSESDCYAAGFSSYCLCMANVCHSPQGQCD